MSKPPYRALRVILGLFALVAAGSSLLMIFGPKPVLIRLFLSPPEAEVSTLLLAMMKELGGVVFTFSLMLFFASRDPARNAAIVDALIAGLCVLAITPLLSLYMLDIRGLYPGRVVPYLIWVRALVRAALAAWLFYLRPRGNASAQAS